jgi:hypothetical protein
MKPIDYRSVWWDEESTPQRPQCAEPTEFADRLMQALTRVAIGVLLFPLIALVLGIVFGLLR